MKASAQYMQHDDPQSSVDEQFVTFTVAGQLFGIPALKVRDVLRRQPLTRVPLALPHVKGAINLRGHIVVAIDVATKLGCPAASEAASMCVVVESDSDVVCLLVDVVGDVVNISSMQVEQNPSSLDSTWGRLSRGVCRMKDRLLLLLDVEALLS